MSRASTQSFGNFPGGPGTITGVNLLQVGGVSFSLGQQLAVASLPVVLTAAQITTLTPPAAITGFALEAGNLAFILTKLGDGSQITKLGDGSGAVVSVIGEGYTFADTKTGLILYGRETGTGASAIAHSLITNSAGELITQSKQNGTWSIGTVTSITNPVAVTGTFWQATQPISAISLPLPSLAATSTKQSDGTQKTQVVDGSGNVIGSTSNALDINIKSGNPTTITATQGTGTNLHTVVDSGIITANPTNPSTLIAFITTITTAGSRVQLASNAIVAGIIEAPSTNTGKIYVGGSTVSSSAYGAELQPGQSVGIQINNTNTIWLDSSVNGDKAAFLGS